MGDRGPSRERERSANRFFGQQIAERAELGSLGHAGAVLVVSRLLVVLFEGAQRELGLATARIDLHHLGVELHARGKMLAQIGPSLGAGLPRGDEPARLSAGGTDDA